MPQKGKPQSPTEKAAASRNLKKFWEENPAGNNLQHGAKSAIVRKRYSDRRTTEGQALAAVMEQIEADLGGPREINAAMRIILGNVRSKLIVLWQLSDYLDRQVSLVRDEDQEALPCLKMYMQTSESLRRDLDKLAEMATKKPAKVPDLGTYLAETYGSGKAGKEGKS
jgi:hypothetical protein